MRRKATLFVADSNEGCPSRGSKEVLDPRSFSSGAKKTENPTNTCVCVCVLVSVEEEKSRELKTDEESPKTVIVEREAKTPGVYLEERASELVAAWMENGLEDKLVVEDSRAGLCY